MSKELPSTLNLFSLSNKDRLLLKKELDRRHPKFVNNSIKILLQKKRTHTLVLPLQFVQFINENEVDVF